MHNNSRIFVSGSIAYDILNDFAGKFEDIIHPDSIQKLSVSFQVSNQHTGYGGTGGNIAYHLGKLGLNPYLIGILGSDDGQRYKDYFLNSGVRDDYIIDKDGVTASANVISDAKQNQILSFYPGASAEKISDDELPDFNSDDIVIVSPDVKSRMIQVAKRANHAHATVLICIGQQVTELKNDDTQELISYADYLFLNQYEHSFVRRSLDLENDATKWVKNLIVTKGGKGSEWISQDEHYTIEAEKTVKTLDPTGAGDAYVAGFAAGIYSDMQPSEVMKLASILGAHVVSSDVTQPDYEDGFDPMTSSRS